MRWITTIETPVFDARIKKPSAHHLNKQQRVRQSVSVERPRPNEQISTSFYRLTSSRCHCIKKYDRQIRCWLPSSLFINVATSYMTYLKSFEPLLRFIVLFISIFWSFHPLNLKRKIDGTTCCRSHDSRKVSKRNSFSRRICRIRACFPSKSVNRSGLNRDPKSASNIDTARLGGVRGRSRGVAVAVAGPVLLSPPLRIWASSTTTSSSSSIERPDAGTRRAVAMPTDGATRAFRIPPGFLAKDSCRSRTRTSTISRWIWKLM